MKYQIKYKEAEQIDIAISDEGILLDQQPVNADIAQLNQHHYHIIKDGRSYDVEILDFDAVSKDIKIAVNGQIFELKPKDELDILLQQMGMGKAKQDKMDIVKAPMPGLVLKILVEPGQHIQKGDSLIVLEAMKMENIIKATGAGIVKSIPVNLKDAVDKNQILIEME